MTLTGASIFIIASGTFGDDVAAGSLLEGQDSKLTTENDIYLIIAGGTFNGNIYGGNLGYKLGANDLVASEDLRHTADTNLEFIVPDTAGTLNINGHILGGSADKGRVDGNARIIFSGDNTNGGLVFGANSMISGDSMHAGWWGETHTSYVAEAANKKRYLEFGKAETDGTVTEFIGDFGISGIVNIDELSFKGSSWVNFTCGFDFHDIDTWNFNYWGSTQSQMTYGGDIEFKEDVLNVTGLDTLAVGDSWKMVSNIANWNWLYEDTEQFSAVTLNGSAASYAAATGNWTSADGKYKLTLADGAGGGIFVQRIA